MRFGACGLSGRDHVESATTSATLAISRTAATGSVKWLMPKEQPAPANTSARKRQPVGVGPHAIVGAVGAELTG